MTVPQPPDYPGPCEGAVFLNQGHVWRWFHGQWFLCVPPGTTFPPIATPSVVERLDALITSEPQVVTGECLQLLKDALQKIDDLEQEVESERFSYDDEY